METYTEETLPDDAHYLGTANDDGTMRAWLAAQPRMEIEDGKVASCG